jgi:hypothetical protein
MYTEKEILQMLGIENYKRQGQARLIPLCARAGLDIRAVSGGGRGVTVKYEIVKDRRVKDEKWIDCIYDNNYEVSDLGGIRRKVSKNNLGYTSENGYKKAAELYESIRGYKDSALLAERCREEAKLARLRTRRNAKIAIITVSSLLGTVALILFAILLKK